MGIIVMHGKHLVSTRHSINADFPSLDQGVERRGWGRSEDIGTPSRDLGRALEAGARAKQAFTMG